MYLIPLAASSLALTARPRPDLSSRRSSLPSLSPTHHFACRSFNTAARLSPPASTLSSLQHIPQKHGLHLNRLTSSPPPARPRPPDLALSPRLLPWPHQQSQQSLRLRLRHPAVSSAAVAEPSLSPPATNSSSSLTLNTLAPPAAAMSSPNSGSSDSLFPTPSPTRSSTSSSEASDWSEEPLQQAQGRARGRGRPADRSRGRGAAQRSSSPVTPPRRSGRNKRKKGEEEEEGTRKEEEEDGTRKAEEDDADMEDGAMDIDDGATEAGSSSAGGRSSGTGAQVVPEGDDSDVEEVEASIPELVPVGVTPAALTKELLEQFFKSYVLEPGRQMGDITAIPADLDAAVPGLGDYCWMLHLVAWGACLWEAVWMALGTTGGPLRTEPSRLPAKADTDGYVGKALDTGSSAQGGRDIRASLRDKYLPDTNEARNRRTSFDSAWEDITHWDSDSALFKDGLALDNEAGPDPLMIWLAAHNNIPPRNVILITTELTITFRPPPPGPAATTDDSTLHLGFDVQPAASTQKTVVVNMSPRAPQLEHTDAKTIILTCRKTTLKGRVAPGDADTGAGVGAGAGAGQQGGQWSRTETKYGVLVGKDGRARWRSADECVELLVKRHMQAEHTYITHDALQQQVRQRAEAAAKAAAKAEAAARKADKQKRREEAAAKAEVERKEAAKEERPQRGKRGKSEPAVGAVRKVVKAAAPRAKVKRGAPSGDPSPAGRKRGKRQSKQSAEEEEEEDEGTQMDTDTPGGAAVAHGSDDDRGGGGGGGGDDDNSEDGAPSTKGGKKKKKCQHFSTCSSSAKCKELHVDGSAHDRSTHHNCSLDFYWPWCPAFAFRNHRGNGEDEKLKGTIMAGDSTGKWRPMPPPLSANNGVAPTLTDPDTWVVPEVGPTATIGSGKTATTNDARVDDAQQRWNEEYERLTGNTAVLADGQPPAVRHSTRQAQPLPLPPPPAPAAGFPPSFFQPPSHSYPYPQPPLGAQWPSSSSSSSSLFAAPPAHSSTAASSSSSTPNSLRAPGPGGRHAASAPLGGQPAAANMPPRWPPPGRLSAMVRGRVIPLPSMKAEWWGSTMAAQHLVPPILFHQTVKLELNRSTTRADHGGIYQFRPHHADRTNTSMPKHLCPTVSDILFERNNCTFIHYRRTPLTLLHDTPLPPTAVGSRVDLTSATSVLSPDEREQEFSTALSVDSFGNINDRPRTYCKDSTDNPWPMCHLHDDDKRPTFTDAEQKQWLAEPSSKKRRVLEAKVVLRAVENDARDGEVGEDAFVRLLEPRITDLTTTANILISDIHQELIDHLNAAVSIPSAQTSAPADLTHLTVALNKQRWEHMAQLQTANPFNLARTPHFFHSLTSLLADHGLRYTGGMTPMLYIKHEVGGDFPLHVEQGYLPFINVCHHGVGLWYVVPPAYESRLIQWTSDTIRKLKPTLLDGFDLAAAPAFLGKAIVRARCLMPDPYALAAQPYNIPVQRFVQEPGDVMIGHGFVWHMGTASTSHVESEAINGAPVWWLTRGLPQLIDMIKDDLAPYLAARETYVSRLRGDTSPLPHGLTHAAAEAVFSIDVMNEYTRLVPVTWLKPFVYTVLYHLRAHLKHQPDPAQPAVPAQLFAPPAAGMSFKELTTAQAAQAAHELSWLHDWLLHDPHAHAMEHQESATLD